MSGFGVYQENYILNSLYIPFKGFTNSIDNTGGRPPKAAAPCMLNTIGISWQACAGHALDFDWLCHWLSPKSGSPWLSWTPDLAN